MSSSSFYEQALTKAEGFSLSHKMCHQLAKWDNAKNAHVIKKISVRILGVITLPFIGLIDTVAHAAMFVGKLGLGICLLPPNIVITLINRKSVHPDLTLSSATVHVNLFMQGCVHTLTLWIVVFFSPAKAAAITGKITVDNKKSKQTIINLTKEVQEANQKNQDLKDEVADANGKVTKLDDEVKKLSDKNDQLQKDKDAFVVQVGDLNAEKALLQNNIGRLGREAVALNGQIRQLQDDLNNQNPNLVRLRAENDQLQLDINAKKNDADKWENIANNLHAEVSGLKQQGVEQDRRIQELSHEVFELKNTISNLTSDNQNAREQLEWERKEKDSYIQLNAKLDEHINELTLQINRPRPLPPIPIASSGPSNTPVELQKPSSPPLPTDPEITRSIESLTQAFNSWNSENSADLQCIPTLTEEQIRTFNFDFKQIKNEINNPKVTTKIQFDRKLKALEKIIEYLEGKSENGFDATNPIYSAGDSILELPPYDNVADQLMQQIKESKEDPERQRALMINLAQYAYLWFNNLSDLKKAKGVAKQQAVKQAEAAQAERSAQVQAQQQAQKEFDVIEWRKVLKQKLVDHDVNINQLKVGGQAELFQHLRNFTADYPILMKNFELGTTCEQAMERIRSFMENIEKSIDVNSPDKVKFLARYNELELLLSRTSHALRKHKR